jgi:hypothetical protein
MGNSNKPRCQNCFAEGDGLIHVGVDPYDHYEHREPGRCIRVLSERLTELERTTDERLRIMREAIDRG